MLWRLRTNSAAPISRTSDKATWVTTRMRPLRTRPRPPMEPRALATRGAIDIDARGLDGGRQAKHEAGEERSGRGEEQDAIVAGNLQAEIGDTSGDERDEQARAGGSESNLRRPPRAATSRLSASNWRIKRERGAPSARRTASSRWRPLARASMRLAMLAQAISSTTPTIAIRRTRGSAN